MKTYIVLLRGVMPTGKNKVSMASLREVAAGAGYENVRTYIQSGNLLVDSDKRPDAIAREIQLLIKEKIGADLPVAVRTAGELKRTLNSYPLELQNTSRLFFIEFLSRPDDVALHELLDQDFGEEKLFSNGKSAALYVPGVYGRGKLSGAFLEKRLGTLVTMRNFNTMKKLIELAGR